MAIKQRGERAPRDAEALGCGRHRQPQGIGCGGLCMRDIGFSSPSGSVVIDQIDIRDVLTVKLEDHAPVAGDRNRPLTRAVATQGMQPGTGKRHVGWHRSRRQSRQHRAQPFHVLGRNAAYVAL